MGYYSERNLFPGVNPHLNSFLQQPGGGWESFHARHISDLASVLDATLPDGYYAVEEKSPQINSAASSGIDPPGRSRRTIPDVIVMQIDKQTDQNPDASAESSIAPFLTVHVEETFLGDDYLSGVMIYRVVEGEVPGKPVTRVELLSPGNKPGGGHYRTYLGKRHETLQTGLCMVEIDYLHETPPISHLVPAYPASGAYPYIIIVDDLRPSIADGMTRFYGVGVDQVLPRISVPLADDDTVLVDFGTVYQQTFESRRLFKMVVDYTQEPVNMDRYSEKDQQFIRARMREITDG